MKKYTPPSTDDLNKLKSQLDYTGVEMAELTGLASGSQWRKYTTGGSPRSMSMQMLYFLASRMVLPEEQVQEIYNKMREIGAEVEE